MLCGRERTSEQRLVDVAESDIFLCEGGEGVGVVPGGVAHFDDARIFDELTEQAVEIFAIERSVFEGDGKLD